MWTGNRTILNVSNKCWYTGWFMLSKKDWSIKSLQLWKMPFSLLHRSSYQSISVHLPQSQSWTASAYRVWKLNKMMDSPEPIHCLCLNRKLFHHDVGMHNKYKTTTLKAFGNQPLKFLAVVPRKTEVWSQKKLYFIYHIKWLKIWLKKITIRKANKSL